MPVGHGPPTTREAARAGDGSFEVDTADPTSSRLPPSEGDCGLLARPTPTHRSNQRPTAQNDPPFVRAISSGMSGRSRASWLAASVRCRTSRC